MNELINIIYKTVDKVKAFDKCVIDFKNQNAFFDYMFIAKVQSQKSANNLVGYLEDEFINTKYKIKSINGINTPWIIIDLYECVIHLFLEEEFNRINLLECYKEYDIIKL